MSESPRKKLKMTEATPMPPKKMMQLNIIDNTSTGSHMAVGQWKCGHSFLSPILSQLLSKILSSLSSNS
jgi:hypothetical protein